MNTSWELWLTMAGCLLLRARLALGKAGERPPRPPLCTEDSKLCMSEWAPSSPGPWPTAWLRRTWMASSRRSSILLCCTMTSMLFFKLKEKHNLERLELSSYSFSNGRICRDLNWGWVSIAIMFKLLQIHMKNIPACVIAPHSWVWLVFATEIEPLRNKPLKLLSACNRFLDLTADGAVVTFMKQPQLGRDSL